MTLDCKRLTELNWVIDQTCLLPVERQRQVQATTPAWTPVRAAVRTTTDQPVLRRPRPNSRREHRNQPNWRARQSERFPPQRPSLQWPRNPQNLVWQQAYISLLYIKFIGFYGHKDVKKTQGGSEKNSLAKKLKNWATIFSKNVTFPFVANLSW